MIATIELDVDEIIDRMKITERTELTKKMVADNLDIGEILESAEKAGYDEYDLLGEINDDTIINYLEERGYKVE